MTARTTITAASAAGLTALLGTVLVSVLLQAPAAEPAVEPPPQEPPPTASATPGPHLAERLAGGSQELPPFSGWVDPASVGGPYGTTVAGLLTFRGNPTRTYYGRGPAPSTPDVKWRYPDEPMCADSVVAGVTREWCGMGWTGQPAVFEREGRTWLVFGAYDGHVHFLDADTGESMLPSFPTDDIIKGSVTVDPDGYPLVYIGSRDDHYRVIAVDGDAPRELWSLWAFDVAPTLWNNDWDGAGLVLDDYLFVGGENSQLHIARLHRGYDDAGRVTVDPELIFNAPGWDDQLLADVGDHNVSIEGSVTIVGDTLYLANSGGLVQGWDIAGLREGRTPERVFRFWTGDDTDATIVADAQGMLYVASQWQRFTDRARAVGQIMKLDPALPEDPLVWSVAERGDHPSADPHEGGPADPDERRPAERTEPRAGVWATPALHRDVLYVPTDGGRLLALDGDTGEVRWEKALQGPLWQSPVVVDDTLLQGDCGGALRAYDVSDTTVEPPERWSVQLDGCIEATPAVWDGTIYVGTRGGYLHAIADGVAGR